MNTSTIIATIDRSPPRGPPGVICYICGRDYRGTRLDMHIRACKRRWEASEDAKPAEERRPVPTEPDNFKSLAAGLGQAVPYNSKELTLVKYNSDALRQHSRYSTKRPVPCPHCRRTISAERLNSHIE